MFKMLLRETKTNKGLKVRIRDYCAEEQNKEDINPTRFFLGL